MKIEFNSGGMAWYTNVAAVSLFQNTNMTVKTLYTMYSRAIAI